MAAPSLRLLDLGLPHTPLERQSNGRVSPKTEAPINELLKDELFETSPAFSTQRRIQNPSPSPLLN